MKKAIYIILIMSSMGFTIASTKTYNQQQNEPKIIAPQTGYLEVSSSASYSLTAGS